MLSREQLRALRSASVGERNRVALAMEMAGVTQVQVAAGTGHTQAYISRIKRGVYSDLPVETTRAFAQFFGCAIEDLFPAPARMSA